MTEQKPQPGARVPSRRGTTHLPTKPPGYVHRPATPDQMTERVNRIMEQVPRFVGSRMALRAWAMKELGLTQSQTDQAMLHVAKRLREAAAEKADETRLRLLAIIDNMLPHCWTYKTGSGGEGVGTVLLKHPETGELLREVDHAAVSRYIDQIAELTGIKKTPLLIAQPYVVTIPAPASNPAEWAKEVQAEIRREETKP